MCRWCLSGPSRLWIGHASLNFEGSMFLSRQGLLHVPRLPQRETFSLEPAEKATLWQASVFHGRQDLASDPADQDATK